MTGQEKVDWRADEHWKAYEQLIGNTGGQDVHELLFGPTHNVIINAPSALIQFAVVSQVGLLYRLKQAGFLRDTPGCPVCGNGIVRDDNGAYCADDECVWETRA